MNDTCQSEPPCLFIPFSGPEEWGVLKSCYASGARLSCFRLLVFCGGARAAGWGLYSGSSSTKLRFEDSVMLWMALVMPDERIGWSSRQFQFHRVSSLPPTTQCRILKANTSKSPRVVGRATRPACCNWCRYLLQWSRQSAGHSPPHAALSIFLQRQIRRHLIEIEKMKGKYSKARLSFRFHKSENS
jgi:hypothetical protein